MILKTFVKTFSSHHRSHPHIIWRVITCWYVRGMRVCAMTLICQCFWRSRPPADKEAGHTSIVEYEIGWYISMAFLLLGRIFLEKPVLFKCHWAEFTVRLALFDITGILRHADILRQAKFRKEILPFICVTSIAHVRCSSLSDDEKLKTKWNRL